MRVIVKTEKTMLSIEHDRAPLRTSRA